MNSEFVHYQFRIWNSPFAFTPSHMFLFSHFIKQIRKPKNGVFQTAWYLTESGRCPLASRRCWLFLIRSLHPFFPSFPFSFSPLFSGLPSWHIKQIGYDVISQPEGKGEKSKTNKKKRKSLRGKEKCPRALCKREKNLDGDGDEKKSTVSREVGRFWKDCHRILIL